MSQPSDCAAVLERVSAYLDRDVDEATCRAIEEHCRGCAACARLVSGLRETVGLCRATGERRLPPEVTARARARIARLLESYRGKR